MKNKNIFVACDVSNQQEILDLLSKISGEISGIKIGLQYITNHSPEEIRELSKFNKPIFYDGKFFDIKNTLVASIKSLKELNIDYATVHLLNGLNSLKAANKSAKEIGIKLNKRNICKSKVRVFDVLFMFIGILKIKKSRIFN